MACGSNTSDLGWDEDEGHRTCCQRCSDAWGSAITSGVTRRGITCSATTQDGRECRRLANNLNERIHTYVHTYMHTIKFTNAVLKIMSSNFLDISSLCPAKLQNVWLVNRIIQKKGQ